MLDPHSGSEYGAARIAAMIAATITIILTGLVSFGFMVPYAQADSFGTLTINAVWNRDAASPKSLAGDTYAIVRVATVTTNSNGSVSSYKTVSDFSGLTADWERLTSSEYHDAAKKLAAHAAKNKLYQHSGTTNAAGQLTFQNLPLGLYLVSRTDSAKANKAYDCDPFLISIPGSGDTAADLNITVEPKFSTSTPPTPPEHEHNPGEMPGNPGVIGNTGAAVGGIAGVAAVILVIAFAVLKLRVRYRSDDTESSHQFRADGGKSMTHSKASFSSAQIKRLIKLRAVVKVSPSRIRYAEWFKRECVMRADAGESPTYLFREAGLGPEFIGEKRIERCMDRWRKKMQLEDLEVASSPERLFSVDMDTAQDREVSKVDVRDVRDLIICKQTRYIESLQRQIDELRLQLAQQTKSNDMQ